MAYLQSKIEAKHKAVEVGECSIKPWQREHILLILLNAQVNRHNSTDDRKKKKKMGIKKTKTKENGDKKRRDKKNER